ncbi:MAG: hypothetical protein ACOYYS_11010 [Chloroflexota bacterium]
MRVIIDFCLRHKRDNIFIADPHLANELFTHLLNTLQALDTTAIAVTNSTSLFTNLKLSGFSVLLSPNNCPRVSWQHRAISLLNFSGHDRTISDNILLLSPFRGVISRERMTAMQHLNPGATGASYSTMAQLSPNQNPIRFNVLGHTPLNGQFRQTEFPLHSLHFAAAVKDEYKNNVQQYADTEFLPDLFAIDEAIIATAAPLLENEEKTLMPVYSPTEDKNNLPLLYRLPVFNFAKECDLQFGGLAKSRAMAISAMSARTGV